MRRPEVQAEEVKLVVFDKVGLRVGWRNDGRCGARDVADEVEASGVARAERSALPDCAVLCYAVSNLEMNRVLICKTDLAAERRIDVRAVDLGARKHRDCWTSIGCRLDVAATT